MQNAASYTHTQILFFDLSVELWGKKSFELQKSFGSKFAESSSWIEVDS